MKGLVLLLVLMHSAQGQCAIHQTCSECNVFVGASGTPCKWCGATSGVMSAGCVDPATACPSSTTVLAVCPASPCETAQTCGECLAKASPSGTACGWCTTSDALNIGCRSSTSTCVGMTDNQFWQKCSFDSPVVAAQVVWPIVFFSLSVGLGLLVGLVVYLRVRGAEVRTLVRACVGLFVVSLFLYGAALFSFLLSVNVAGKMMRKCCGCYCFWIWFCGCFELSAVLAGVLTGMVVDE